MLQLAVLNDCQRDKISMQQTAPVIMGETRVSATPETLKKLTNFHIKPLVVQGAGLHAQIPDNQFQTAGAELLADNATALKRADIITSVLPPTESEIKSMRPNIWLLAPLNARQNPTLLKQLAGAEISAFALEMIPRISRAQNMDILSSQANLAGYRAVLLATQYFQKSTPMMMTAAGTLSPAKFLIMGVGVAGLQAIATAKRLGAQVLATDVRPATKEQVESLGANFLAVMDKEFQKAESQTGYAKPMSANYKKKQAELIKSTLPKIDVVITTALIPGATAPQLLTSDMVKLLPNGAVVIDMAVATGGNVAGSKYNQVVIESGKTLIGLDKGERLLPAAASQLFARNIYNFLENLWQKDEKKLTLKLDDDIVKGCLVTHAKQILLGNPLNHKL